MTAQYAQSYIDKIYDSNDLFALHNVVDVVSQGRDLPQAFWLFSRLWEWACSTRSGIWQYYEGLTPELQEMIPKLLHDFGLAELAEKYESGVLSWTSPNRCEDLDAWIDTNWSKIEEAALSLVAEYRGALSSKS